MSSTIKFTNSGDFSGVSTPNEDNGELTGRFGIDTAGDPKIRLSDGTLKDFVGPTGPTGPTGPQGPIGPPGTVAQEIVADITDPTEIESLTLAVTGNDVVAKQVVGSSGSDLATTYIYDADGPVKNAPYVMNTGDGGTTRWVAVEGRFINQATESNSTVLGSNLQTVAQAEAEAGVATTTRLWTAERVRQAIEALAELQFDPSLKTTFFEDWVTGNEDQDEMGTYGWRMTSSGTGNQTSRLTAVAGHPGILRQAGGTAGAARSVVHAGESGVNTWFLGSGEIFLETLFRITGTLSNHERSLVGLCDPVTTNGAIVDGIYVGINGGAAPDSNWHLVSVASSTETRRDLGATAAFSSGSWIRLGFLINAAGTSIQGYVNGTATGSPITTNIPAVALSPVLKTDALSIGSGIATPFDNDYLFIRQIFSNNRENL